MFKYEAGCLVATVTGRYVIDRKESAVKDVADAINAQPVKAALVDLREISGSYAFMDRHQPGELAGRYLTKVPIAVLIQTNQADPQLIGKLVANNRGASPEVFTDPAAAEAWSKKYQIPDREVGSSKESRNEPTA